MSTPTQLHNLHLSTGLADKAGMLRVWHRFEGCGLAYLAGWVRVMGARGRIDLSRSGELTAAITVLPTDPMLRAEAEGLRELVQRLWCTALLDETQLEAQAKATLAAIGITEPPPASGVGRN